jgi:hypothetical protein
MPRFLLGLFCALLLSSALSAQPYTNLPLVANHPTSMTGVFADQADAVPDATGDGVMDLVVSGGGAAHLYSGADGQWVRSYANPTTDTTNSFSAAVCGVGDVDGDGLGDVLIGAPNENYSATEYMRGRAYLFSGATGQLLHTFQSAGTTNMAMFGMTVSAISDLDGDSRPDLLISAPLDNHNATTFKYWGAVYVFSSATGQQLLRISQDEADVHASFGLFGYSLATMPDWDGDGKPEIIIGNPGDADDDSGSVPGLVYIVSAKAGAPLLTIASNHAIDNGQFGSSVAYLGDTNGDGQPDLAIGAPAERIGTTGALTGLVHLLRLPAYSATPNITRSILTPPKPLEGGLFGSGVKRVPDATGNGIDELAVSALGPILYSSSKGDLVHLYSAAGGSPIQTFDLGLTNGVGNYLAPMVGLTSVDGDARGDFAIGTFANRNSDGTYGQLRIYTTRAIVDPTPTPLPTPTPTPTPTPLPASQYYYTPPAELAQPYDITTKFGSAVAIVPDINHDDVPDMLVGEQESLGPVGESRAGAAYVYSGRTGQKLLTLFSPNAQSSGFFGVSVAGMQDVNGDGAGDLLVGAYGEKVHSNYNGNAYLFSGADGRLLHSYSAVRRNNGYDNFQCFGQRVTAIADQDGDGKQDIAVGAPWEFNNMAPPLATTGVTYYFSSVTGNQLQRLIPDNPDPSGDFDSFGNAICEVPDWTGDGKSDMVIGAYGTTSYMVSRAQGYVYLFYGHTATCLTTLYSPSEDPVAGNFGVAIASLGDFDGDHYGDAAIGAPGEKKTDAPAASGVVYLYSLRKVYSNPSLIIPTLTSPHPVADGRFGSALALVPDVDGDGQDDLAIGAPGEPGPNDEAKGGRIYIFSMKTRELLQTLFSPHATASDGFGATLASELSIDQDALGDLLVGAAGEPYSAQQSGRTYLFTTGLWPWPNAVRHFELYE